MIRASLTRKKRFWFEHRTELPLHYQTYVPEVGSQKASSSNVESVFSGVGGMVQKATTLGAELTENYTICHHNWLYEFLEPSDEEIIAAYVKLNGFEPHDTSWTQRKARRRAVTRSPTTPTPTRAKRAIRCKPSDF